MSDARPFNQETDPRYNLEPGLVLVQGSAIVREHAKFEQFHTKYTTGTVPGNPYQYRPFPKMLYRAESYNGKPCCMAAPPNWAMFKNSDEARFADEQARQFTERCQMIVKDESEMQRALENGWREDPQQAVEYLEGRTRRIGTATAERLYRDRNMSDRAKAEADAATAAAGGDHQPEIKAKRGRPRKA